MNNESSMEHTLKNGAKLLGLFLLAISIYLSYDGFDQGVTGGNDKYSNLAKLIGLVIAVSVGALQFIFSSRYEQLNTTLKGAGLISYAYSIWTNYMGAKHLLGMNDTTALATAFFMDIVPEPMIAWGLGDAMKGDVIGNLGKWFTNYQPKMQNNQPQQQGKHQQEHSKPQHPQGKQHHNERIAQLQKMYHGEDRRNGGQGQRQHQGGGQNHQNTRPREDR
jgi:hypothetical protein